MHPRSTHTPSELARLEEDTGLHFAGYLFDDRCLLPVLVRPIHNQAAQRGIIERLNNQVLLPIMAGNGTLSAIREEQGKPCFTEDNRTRRAAGRPRALPSCKASDNPKNAPANRPASAAGATR